MSRRLFSLLALLMLSVCAPAQSPDVGGGSSAPFQVDPAYLLSARQGPFMIYLCSFRGDDAGKLAQDLVRELRGTYKMSAFLLRRVDEEAAAERDRIRAEQMQRYGEGFKRGGKKVRVLEDWAVLVGDYRDLQAAHNDLKRVKAMEKPKSMNIFSTLLAGGNPRAERPQPGKPPESKKVGDWTPETFNRAFATRNPLAPKPVLAKEKEDLKKLQMLNQFEKHALTNCKAPFTLVVMEFRGPVDVSDDKPSVFDQKSLAGSRSPYAPDKNHLEHGVFLAQRLAEQLRDNGKGYEAYLLHTSRSTVVTVGGFKSAEDPEMQKARQALAGQNVGGIQLLRAPYPCQVPRF